MSDSQFGVFDLASASAAAAQAIQASPDPAAPPAPPVAEPTPPPVPETSADPSPVAPANAEPSAFELTLTHRGRPVTVTDPEEAKGYAQKGLDYTVKTQELAQAKRELEAREQAWLQREQQVVSFLNDDSRVAAYLQSRRGPLAAPAAQAAPSADDLLTVGQVQQLLEGERQRIHQELSAVRDQIPQVTELMHLRNQWAQDVESHLAGLQTKFPELQAVENFGGIMKNRMREHLQTNPIGDLETAKAVMADWAKSQALKIRAVIDTQTKQTLARQAKARPAIEPPGGAPTTSSGVDTTHMRVGDPRLSAIVAEAMQRARG